MDRGDWGWDEEELGRFVMDRPLDSIESDDAADLPEVRLAIAEGFEPAHEAPLWCFVPTLWPRPHRTWLRDRRARQAQMWCTGPEKVVRTIPWSAATYFMEEEFINGLLQECGFGPRPAGRIWLLRPPPGFGTLASALDTLAGSADAAGELSAASASFARHVERSLQLMFSRG